MDFLSSSPYGLPKDEDENEHICALPSTMPDSCSSSSFLTLDTSLSFGDRRRSSSASTSVWASPDLFSASSAGTISPATPINAGLVAHDQYLRQQSDLGFASLYNLQKVTFDDHEVWQHETPSMLALNTLSNMQVPHLTDTVFGTTDYNAFSQCLNNPALSRPIFQEAVQTPLPRADAIMFDWTSATNVQPQTIVPSAAFQPILSSSPALKEDPTTPQRHFPSSVALSSSPSTLISPIVLPSQNDVDEEDYTYADQLASLMDDHTVQRNVASRLSRRPYERKGPHRQHKPKSAASKSGVECEAVIPQYEHICSYPGCINKSTGLQKRFKRQEHKKRHERTVHESHLHANFKCWVPQCKTPAFTRTDNLKSHLRNTHGKKSASARNRYVATLDFDNEFYDPEWKGDLDDDGYPKR